MIGFKLFPLFWALFLLAGCGNLEWPPKNSVIGYNINNSRLMHTGESPGRHQNVTHDTIPFTAKTADKHIVEAGETLSGIAQYYHTGIYELAILNQIEPPFRIYVGQSITIPNSPKGPVQLAAFKRSAQIKQEDLIPPYGSSPTSPPRDFQRAPITSNEANFLKVKPGIKPLSQRKLVALPSSKTKSRQTKKVELGVSLPPVGKGSPFIWPVEGKLVSKFGVKGEGLRNDGVNIVAPRGTVVRAARPGAVAYAGNELRGFGNLLLIKHGNNWVTAYAHNETLLVRRGERVRQGQVIARVGSSGNVVQPQLHFEIRKGNTAVDPLHQISRSASRRRQKNRRTSKS